ncbi:MFS1 family protein [Verticillium alfalfae VaMs.102]|uniref:MFS1 family protein n=1 Tax=Verticillium alfalfae (strain VaMs.102 / ATCC MYA-4576 / FGSC 10136) TaxID=526221 RepID=C9S5F9_VERA1|nr:MFS1 family protein [Verticillium alfalfae VaMs.102]EEY15036.1 MFS1 family protein [Verticillium alfalfae VaMs.102]
MDKATRISTIAKPATSHGAQHKARVVSLDVPPPVPPKDPPRPATSSTTRSGPATRPIANATAKLQGATMSSRPTTSSTRPGTSSTLAGTMSSIQGAGSKIKAGLRPLKLAALTSHPTRPMPTISRPQTASNTTVASPVRPMTSSTRRFSRSTTMTGRTIKYGSGRHATTELSPQPSDDEDDPLNWPLWKKDLNLFALLVTVCLVSAMKTAFIPVAAKLAIQFQVSHTAIASLTALPFIFSSITGLASVTASKIWGKRPVYLLSMVFLFIGSLWNMRSTTFGTALGARIFQGIGWGAFDTLILSSIHDTYFEHQRNPRLAAYDILQAATAWGPPLLSGLAMRNAGRFEIHFEILNLFFIVAIPLLAFAAPETAYDRWFIATRSLPPARRPGRRPAARSASFVDNRTLLQGPRALIAPTTALLALATFLPYSALWAIAHVVSPLTAAILDEAQIGFLLLAPFLCGVSAAALFAFWRRKARKDFTLLNLVAALGVGTVLAAIGILSFGLEIHGSRNLSFKLLSVLAGFLAVGVYVLNALARPVIYRSAQYTSSNCTFACVTWPTWTPGWCAGRTCLQHFSY